MMTREQLMLTKLAEEAAEVAQIALKAQQFGLDEVCPGQPLTNRQRLHKELDDLNGVLSELNAKHGLDYVPSTQAIADKRAKMAHYADYAQSLGRVTAQHARDTEVAAGVAPMASYTLAIVADSGYEATTVGSCTADQYGAALAALHGTTTPTPQVQASLTDEQIMQFMAPWHVHGDAEDRADLIRSVRAMLTEAGADTAPQGVSI